MESDENGSTSLHWAASGIDPLAHISNFHAAALAGKEEVVRELITKYQCPVNYVYKSGDTVMNLAAMDGHASVRV